MFYCNRALNPNDKIHLYYKSHKNIIKQLFCLVHQRYNVVVGDEAAGRISFGEANGCAFVALTGSPIQVCTSTFSHVLTRN